MEVRSVPFSQTLPWLGSRSAIMRRNRLLPDPDGPVMAAHAPAPRLRSNGPANSLRSSFTTSAVCIEFPCLRVACQRSPKIRAPPITAFSVIEYPYHIPRAEDGAWRLRVKCNSGLFLQKVAPSGHTPQFRLSPSWPLP